MFEKALELDPQYAEAYAYLSTTYFLEWFYWNRTPQALKRAEELAQQAVLLDETVPLSHTVLGSIYLWEKQYDKAVAEGKRGIALDPNNAETHANLGQTLAFAGQPEEAIEAVKKAMRLNPHYPVNYLFQLSIAYRMAGRYEEALEPGKQVVALIPNTTTVHFNLAVIYSELGRIEEAQAEATEIRRLSPFASLDWFKQRLPFKDPAVLERHIVALRKAGLK